jgi:hypothetical protein
VFDPELPGFFGNILVDPLDELPSPGQAIQARKIFVEFYAVDDARDGLDRLIGGWCRTTRIVGHLGLLEGLPFGRYRKRGEIPSPGEIPSARHQGKSYRGIRGFLIVKTFTQVVSIFCCNPHPVI